MTPATDRDRSESDNLPRMWRHQESPGLWLGLGLGSIGLHALLLLIAVPLSVKLATGSPGSPGSISATSIEMVDLPTSNATGSIAATPPPANTAAAIPTAVQTTPSATTAPENGIGFSSLTSIDTPPVAPLTDSAAIATSSPTFTPTPPPTLPPRLEPSLPLTPSPSPSPVPPERSALDGIVSSLPPTSLPPTSLPPTSLPPTSLPPTVPQTNGATSTAAAPATSMPTQPQRDRPPLSETSPANSQPPTPQPPTSQPPTPPTDTPGRLPEPPVLPEVVPPSQPAAPTDATVDVNQESPTDPVLLVSLQVVAEPRPANEPTAEVTTGVQQPAQLLSFSFEFKPTAEICRAQPEAFDFLGTPIAMRLSIDPTGQITGEEPMPPPGMEQIRYYQLVRCILKNAAKFQPATDADGQAIADQITIAITLTRQ